MSCSSRNTEVGDSLEDGDTPDVEMTGVGIDQPDRNGLEESSAGQVDVHSMSDVSPMDWTLDGEDGPATGGYSEGDIPDTSQMAGRQINPELRFTIEEHLPAIEARLSAIENNQTQVDPAQVRKVLWALMEMWS